MANFPTSLDNGTSLPNPSAGNNTNNPSHAGLHDAENAAIIATETKLGTGASTPSANTLLFGNGSGTSAWTQLTSAQMAASVSDETGSGSLVFSNTPTLITPKVDTINEATLNNGVTLAGMNVKAGVLSTPGTALGTGGVTGANLSTSAITLGYAQITSNVTTTSGSATQISGLTSTVTIPAGGRRVKVTAFVTNAGSSSTATFSITLWDGTVGSGTQIGQALINGTSSGDTKPLVAMAVVTPAAGSKTYNVGFQTSAGTLTVVAGSVFPAFILVEAI